MKKLITFVFLTALLSFCSAIAVIPPAIYVATLSLTAFLANIFITIAIFIAAKSFSNKNTLSKGLTQKIGFGLELIGKTALLIICTTFAIALINPILINEAILTGGIAAGMCAIILFLYNYKKLSIKNSESRKRILKTILVFSIFVFISSSIGGYYSIETKILLVNGQEANQTQSMQNNSPLADIVSGFVSNQSQVASAPEQGLQKETAPRAQILIFNPINSDECNISSSEKTISIKPKTNCFSSVNEIQQRVICPIILNESEFLSGSKITSSGSCSETYTIE
ncbi:MAG: hypothetical protein WCW44_00885 [archaeon]